MSWLSGLLLGVALQWGQEIVVGFVVLGVLGVLVLAVVMGCWAVAAVRRAFRLVRLILTRDVDRVVLDARAGVSL